jgi:hypothetical protein
MRLTEIRTDPRPVAVARIGVGFATILNSLEAYDILAAIASGRLAMPVFEGVPTPTTPALIAYVVLAIAAGVAVMLGWKTAPAALLSVILSVAVFLLDQQTYSSHRVLATIAMACMVFAMAGTAWSVRPAPGRPTVVFWPQLLMITQLSVCYLFSALSKLNFTFISGAGLAEWVWLELPWQYYTIAAVMTVVVELIIAVCMWFPASRRAAALFGLGLHLSIIVLMNNETIPLIGFAVTCVSLYPLFLFRPSLRASRMPAAIA